MFKSLVVWEWCTFSNNISLLKAFIGLKVEFNNFLTEMQLNNNQSWRTCLLGFADTYTDCFSQSPAQASPHWSSKWRNNVILFLASFNEIYWMDRSSKSHSTETAALLVLCWAPSRPIDVTLKAAELPQGGAGWCQSGSFTEILEHFYDSCAFRWQLKDLVSSRILLNSPLVAVSCTQKLVLHLPWCWGFVIT